MYLEKILEDVLPTKWSRWTAVLTVLTSIAVLPLPYLWPFSVLIKTDTERQIFQVLLSVSTLLIGTLICLLLVIIAYHKKTKEFTDEIYKLKNPPISFTEINVDLNAITNSKFWPDLGVTQDLNTGYYICPKCSHFLRIDKDGLHCAKCDNFIPVNMSEALLKHIEFLKRFTNVT